MKHSERERGLEVTGLFIAVEADPDRMVPATRGDSPAVVGAIITEALPAGPAVVLGELDAELLPAVVAVQDLMVRHPVRRPGSIFHQPCAKEWSATVRIDRPWQARAILRYLLAYLNSTHHLQDCCLPSPSGSRRRRH